MNKTHDPKWKPSIDKKQSKERGGSKKAAGHTSKAHAPMGKGRDRSAAPGNAPKAPSINRTAVFGNGDAEHMLKHGHRKLTGGLIGEMCAPKKLANVMAEDENEGESVKKQYDGYHGPKSDE